MSEDTVDKIQAAYDRRLDQVGKAIDDVESYTKANPWMALAAALLTGLVVGHVRGASGRKVVYVRKVKPDQVA